MMGIQQHTQMKPAAALPGFVFWHGIASSCFAMFLGMTAALLGAVVLPYPEGFVLSVAAGGCIAGAMQGLALRRYFRLGLWWLVISTVGWLGPALLLGYGGQARDEALAAWVLLGAPNAIVVGLLQFGLLCLAPLPQTPPATNMARAYRAWWVLISFFAWMLMLLLTSVVGLTIIVVLHRIAII